MAAQLAPVYPIPFSDSEHYAGIEYPGPVRNVPRALKTLGGLAHVSRTLTSSPHPAVAIELNLHPSNKFHHPVPAAILESGNVLVRVVKRRRKRPKLDEHGHELDAGIYTIEAVGVVTKTVRFRGMADFQYTPPVVDDPIVAMADAMRAMDVAAIKDFSFPEPNEDFAAEALYLPPPAFSRVGVPQIWDYKAVPASVPAPSSRPSNEEVQRLINSSRWKGKPMMTIAFADPDVPTEPNEDLVKLRKAPNVPVEEAILKLLDRRPVWTRTGLLNELPPEHARSANNHKHIVSLSAYSFSDGPFRDMVIRFGYDPRTDPEARFYQHIFLRNVTNVRSKKTIMPLAATVLKPKEASTRKEHLFDGKTAHGKIANFQLCDISDPLLQSLIQSRAGVLPACLPDLEGWWDRDYFEQMRNVVRRKFLGCHNNVLILDTDCEDLLGNPKTVWVTGSKGTKQGKAVDSDASRDGSASETDADEPGGGSGSEAGEAGEDRKKRRKAAIARGKAKASWEPTRKKKKAQAKKPAKGETAEEKADRLRAVLGLQGDGSNDGEMED